VLDNDKAENIVPDYIQLKTGVTGKAKLQHGLMFFLICGGGAAIFLALVFVIVILFIHYDLDLNTLSFDDEMLEDEDMDENGFSMKQTSNSRYTSMNILKAIEIFSVVLFSPNADLYFCE